MLHIHEENEKIEMVWRYVKNTGIQKKSSFENDSKWWTTTITEIQIQLVSETIKQLKQTFNMAFNNNKPLTLFIKGNLRSNFAKLNNEPTGRKPNLWIEAYGGRLYTKYDPKKINNLSENSIKLYYRWEDVPTALKEFILNKPKERQITFR